MLKNLWGNFSRFFDDHEPNVWTIAILGTIILLSVSLVILAFIFITKLFGPTVFIVGLLGWAIYVVYWMIKNGYFSFKPTDEV